MGIDRRAFLRNAAIASAGLGLGSLLPRTAHAQSWGDLPSGASWPTPVKVLEIFCYSGLSQWETFWLMESAGAVNFNGFDQEVAELTWHCPASPSPTLESTLFGQDASGANVHWGPATKPLWRPDIFTRTRMVAIGHDQLAHALAIPLALTGHKLGNPRAAGMGAAVQHQQMSRAVRSVPYAYVIAPDDIMWEFTVGAAAANGSHPGYAQPLIVRIGDPAFLSLLNRTNMNPDSDALIRTYQAMEADRLRYQGHDPVRSTGFASYSSSVDSVLNAPALHTQLTSVSLTVPSTVPCASAHLNSSALPAAQNRVQTELDLATALLTTGGARYVCVIDRGPDREPGGTPYDLHYDDDTQPLARILSNNVFNLCQLLADKIDSNDPTKLHLDDTLIIIHSEFGRTIVRDPVQNGRNHWPYGYAAILIGGPSPNRSIVGRIDTMGSAFGTSAAMSPAFSPTDIRGALLLAAGVDPLAQENFGVGDFTPLIQATTASGQSGEDAIRANLQTNILGL